MTGEKRRKHWLVAGAGLMIFQTTHPLSLKSRPTGRKTRVGTGQQILKGNCSVALLAYAVSVTYTI